MTFLIMVAFIGLIAGSFLLLRLSPFEFAENMIRPLQNRKKPIGKQIEEAKLPRQARGIRKTIQETKEVLVLTGKSTKFGALCALSCFLLVVGVLVSMLLDNFFMIPVAAVGMALLPFWYILFTAHSYKKQMNAELETALSVITTSYLRNESIITAVEENIAYLNPPVADIFQGFLAETKLINVNVKQALGAMKPRLNSPVFHEWIDAMTACQEDKTLKTTLTPIISKLSDMRVVSAELDYMMYEPLKEFITMALLLIGNIPLIYFLNKDWYAVLMNTGFGKSILAVCGAVIFASLAAVIRLTKPIDYKR
ncbi:MAG: hypothetical protein WHF31_06235 [Candidatus Dehalobacter alkaniphilus]|uniref:type II secretion system F family protein n=1 Tax=Dehalobacter sp. DCM TaxID=2907827 RepID=UPI003081D1E9|nr:hypothetical protein LPY66_01595 [Dehalobacter sp. DCM]